MMRPGDKKGTLTIADATISDELESRLHIIHGNGLPYPSPVPDDLDSHCASIELEALRRKLLLAAFETYSTSGKSDIGNASTATILRVKPYLGRARSCSQLDVLKTCGLRDLVVGTGNQGF